MGIASLYDLKQDLIKLERLRFLFCFVADMVQKQWKTLRGQFTREHRLQKIYEPSGTGNNTSKRPRKTWYLYQSLLFLVPYITHRRVCSNFVRKKITSAGSSLNSAPSTSQSVSNSPLQLPLESVLVTTPGVSPSESASTTYGIQIYTTIIQMFQLLHQKYHLQNL